MSRPRWNPSEKDRREIETMAGYGMAHDMIARIKGITRNTLLRHCKPELEMGKAKAMLVATGALHKLINRANPSAAAVKFYLSTQGGEEWRAQAVQPLGKKEEAELNAQRAEEGTEWAGLLN